MFIRLRTLLVSAALCGATGIVLVIVGYNAWREYRSYTVETIGEVSQRTQTFVAVRLEGEIPGGSATVEVPYRVLSGGRSDVPTDGSALELGDRVALVYPPGKPAEARLAEGLAPSVPPWTVWLGAGLVLLAALATWIVWHFQRKDRKVQAEASRPIPADNLIA